MPTAYEGRKPYVFVSYSHKDTPLVMQVIEAMEKNGILVWYDGGIEAGSEWPEYIASHLRNCVCMLSFISANFVKSANCRRELNFGQDLQKDILNIYIDDVELSDGMKMQLGLNQAIFKKNYRTDEDFFKAICAARIVRQCKTEITQQTPPPAPPRKERVPVAPPIVKERNLERKQSFKWKTELLLLGVLPLSYVLLWGMEWLLWMNGISGLARILSIVEFVAIGFVWSSLAVTVLKKSKAFLGMWFAVFVISYLIRIVFIYIIVGGIVPITIMRVSIRTLLETACIAAAIFGVNLAVKQNNRKTLFVALAACISALIFSLADRDGYVTAFAGIFEILLMSSAAAFVGVYLFKKMKCF